MNKPVPIQIVDIKSLFDTKLRVFADIVAFRSLTLFSRKSVKLGVFCIVVGPSLFSRVSFLGNF